MRFPVKLTFKLLAIASQIYIRDSGGQLIGYVKQKLFRLKEEINVFADEEQTQLRYTIKADRVIDLSARYNFSGSRGQQIGAIKRQGLRSIWKANYEIFDASGRLAMSVSEDNAWIKVADALSSEIPVLGMFAGYLFHPSYTITRTDGRPAAQIRKRPAFFEGVFELSAADAMTDTEEELVLLSTLTMTLLERGRG